MDAAMCDAAVRKVMSHSSELRARTPAGCANGTQIYET